MATRLKRLGLQHRVGENERLCYTPLPPLSPYTIIWRWTWMIQQGEVIGCRCLHPLPLSGPLLPIHPLSAPSSASPSQLRIWAHIRPRLAILPPPNPSSISPLTIFLFPFSLSHSLSLRPAPIPSPCLSFTLQIWPLDSKNHAWLRTLNTKLVHPTSWYLNFCWKGTTFFKWGSFVFEVHIGWGIPHEI